MTVFLNYKGFAFEDAIEHQPPERSAELAVGTYYHCWFEVLKRSPWYLKKLQLRHHYPEVSSRVLDSFGDITQIDFKQWWVDAGYKIFSEAVPYEPVQSIGVQAIRPKKMSVKQKKQNTLLLSLPLNLAKEEVLRQVGHAFDLAQDDLRRRIAQSQENANDADEFNRHIFSTAEVYLYDDNRLNPSTIWQNLQFFQHYVEARRLHGRSYKQYEFAKEEGLTGVLPKRTPMKNKASNAVSDKLKGIYRLMAHATDMQFPCNEKHDFANLTAIDTEFFSDEGEFLYGPIAKAEGAWPKPKTGKILDADRIA